LPCVRDGVRQDGGDAFSLEQLARFRRGGGGRGPVPEVVEVDAQLLLHGGLVLDHQDRRTEHVGGAVDLEAGRQRRQPDLAAPGLSPSAARYAWFLQGHLYMSFNDYSLDANTLIRIAQPILSVGPGVGWK